MFNFQIDISDILIEFQSLASRSGELKEAILDRVTDDFMHRWEGNINNELHQTKSEYRKAMFVERPEEGVAIIGLTPRESQLALMIEDGASSWDMKCIVNRYTPVLTSKGNIPIYKIKVGDLVLTHKGRFRKVTKTNKEANTDDFIYEIEINNNKKIQVTESHPILTSRGWVFAKNLNKSDKIIVLGKKCDYCGNIFSIKKKEDACFCDKSCSNRHKNLPKKGKKREDLSEEAIRNISNAAKVTNKRMIEEGKHVSQREDFVDLMQDGVNRMSDEDIKAKYKKIAQTLGRNSRFSHPEKILWEKIKNINNIERQYQFFREKYYFRKSGAKRKRFYYFDFAIPEHKICIEVNGERFHTKEQDDLKKIEVEGFGWTYLSFWGKEIYSDVDSCAKEIFRVLKNHNGEYLFTESNFTIKKVSMKSKSHLSTMFNFKYDLTVEEDSSFLANGVVVHNSGFKNSDKAKNKGQDNWYLTIPFRHATSEAVAESSIFSNKMDKVVEKEVKRQGTLNDLTSLPQEYQKILSNPTTGTSHKSPIVQGLKKMDISSTNKEKRSGYFTFRRVGGNSEEGSWVHRGFEARKLMEKTQKELPFETLVQMSVDDFLTQ